MSLPSFSVDCKFQSARISLLEVRDRMVPKEETAALAVPLAVLVVERTETLRLSADGVLKEARFELSYRRLDPPALRGASAGSFAGGYCRFDSEHVSITSGSLGTGGGVFLDLPGLEGQRIGTYLMNQVVLWVKQWPQAHVRPVHLQSSDARHQDNQLRRNRLYEQFGLAFDYDDDAHKSGRSRPMAAADLVPCDAWQRNITVLNVLPWIDDVLLERRQAQEELATRQRALKQLHSDIRAAQARPLRWAMCELWRKALAHIA